MPAFKVEATQEGYYDGRLWKAGEQFVLTDKKGKDGQMLTYPDGSPMTAESQFAEAKGRNRYG